MADVNVKWIKIATGLFDDDKILIIESMPSADSIIVIWFKLLTFAGKQNNGGVFIMSDRIAYTEEMLAAIFRRDINLVRLALRTFEQLGMIEIINNVVTVPNWSKHQSLDALERKRERDRAYQAERRAQQKLLALGDTSEKKSSDTSLDISSDVAPLERDIERDIDKDIKKESKREKKSDSDESEHPPSSDVKTKKGKKSKKPKAPEPEKKAYGEFQNVFLTDDELEKLKSKYSDYQERIEKLSAGIESKGYKYKSHYATIISWANSDSKKSGRKEPEPKWMTKSAGNYNSYSQRQYSTEELDELEEKLTGVKTAGTDPGIAARAEALQERLKG